MQASSLAKGYDPLYSSRVKMSRADRNPWLAKMICKWWVYYSLVKLPDLKTNITTFKSELLWDNIGGN